jgi:predicted nucleotidyltransferase
MNATRIIQERRDEILRLTADLEQLLGKRVQVVIHRSLSPLIREAVLGEAIPL